MKLHWCLPLAALVALAVSLAPARGADDDGVSIKVAGDRIEFHAGKALVATYHKGENVAKPYFWPLNGPGGVPLTRAWPMVKGKPGESTDHVHQKSAWFCHGDVIPEGLELKVRSKDKNVKGVD